MSLFIKRQQTGPPPDPAYCAESNAHEILGVTGAMMTLAVIIMGMRLAVRAAMLKSVGGDDYVMLAATLMAVATFVCFVGESHHGVGRHLKCISPAAYQAFAKWQWAHSLVVMWGVILVKISIALFLMRLVPPGKRWKTFLWALIVFMICFLIACSGTLIWQCVPIDAAWDFSKKATANCYSHNTFSAIGLTNSSINCATDFLLAALPVPIIIKLQVNRRTKITLVLILSLGYIACAAGIVKAVKQARFFGEADPLWHNAFNVWNQIELCVGIVAASLPCLKPLFANILLKTRTMLTGHSGGSLGESKIKSQHGYQRHHGHDPKYTPSDIQMSDMKKNMSNLSGTTYGNGHSRSMSTPKSALKAGSRDNPFYDSSNPADRPYAVAITTGPDTDDAGSWDEVEHSRSMSEERLTQPTGIYKTTAIVKSSYDRIPPKR
ncbi:hypothetical protein AC578_10745 [Pseudocercospora eumusae]|uniref:Rhodopsin domain-containing protein n=1 Tax=Pseudocercospora eumusae TaxID=321146 RepID=A0A139H4D6_9PEZI|nr:hypothetical protein AC578_10745 [Pseudocercospora eumusae]